VGRGEGGIRLIRLGCILGYGVCLVERLHGGIQMEQDCPN
jgi:hypothetical protein